MAVQEIEVKFRKYTCFEFKSRNLFTYKAIAEPYMYPLKTEIEMLDAGKRVYVFRTNMNNEVYHYATYEITDSNKDKKFGVPLSEFGTKVKCFFIISDFKLNINYIECLRKSLENDYANGKSIIQSINHRYTFANFKNNYEEWNTSSDSFSKSHAVYDKKDDYNYVYLLDYKYIMEKYREIFNKNLRNLNEFYTENDSLLRKKYGAKYIQKRELGNLIKGVSENLDKWSMLEKDGQYLKLFLNELDNEQVKRFKKLDISARVLITWLKSVGFNSYIRDYDYHDKSTSDLLIPLIDDLDKVESGAIYTVQELLHVIKDYENLKNIPSLRDKGSVSSSELSKMIDNQINYSSLLSLILKGVKESDTKFRDICKALSNVFYTKEVAQAYGEEFTKMVFKYKYGMTITFTEVDVVKEFGPQKSCFTVDLDGNIRKARFIKLEKANWLQAIKSGKEIFDNIEKAIIIIDFAICTYKLCALSMSGKTTIEKNITTIASFAKASSDLLRSFVFSKLVENATNASIRTTLLAVKSTLTWISAIINVGMYTWKTIEDCNQMDYDAAFGSGLVALGSVGTGLVSVGVLSAETGVGLIILIIGIILIIAGIIIKIFCDDDNIDEYLKECQWGKYNISDKKNYDDYQKQFDRFYKLIVNYNIFIRNQIEGRPTKMGFGEGNKIRGVSVVIDPTCITPITSIKIKLSLLGRNGSVVLWEDNVFEKTNLMVVRKKDGSKTQVSFLKVFFADNQYKPNLDDFNHAESSAEQIRSLGYITEDDDERYKKIIIINNMEKTIMQKDKYLYDEAKAEIWIDLNGDGSIIVEQKPVTCPLSVDESDRIKNNSTFMIYR